MRDVSCFQGTEELKKIKKYATDSLDSKEKLFVRKMSEKIEAYVENESLSFLTFSEVVKLRSLWQKYQHLEPFVFRFDPKKRMPKIFWDRIAFIIWAVWKNYHFLGKEDLKKAALLAANILSKAKPPYTYELKKEAVETFTTVMENTGYYDLRIDTSIFWTKKIFPYLDGAWEFKWKVKS